MKSLLILSALACTQAEQQPYRYNDVYQVMCPPCEKLGFDPIRMEIPTENVHFIQFLERYEDKVVEPMLYLDMLKDVSQIKESTHKYFLQSYERMCNVYEYNTDTSNHSWMTIYHNGTITSEIDLGKHLNKGK